MFDDIFNNENNENDNFKKFYFSNWFIDPSKLFKGSLNDSRNGKWIWGQASYKKPRIENVCVATLDDSEQNWYKDLTSRQQDVSKRLYSLNKHLERTQHEQAILDIDINHFNDTIREKYGLSDKDYPELTVGEDSKHIYHKVDLTRTTDEED